MTMAEIVEEVSFRLGLPTNNNVEAQQIEKAVLASFRELKRYMKTPTHKTVPYSPRLDLIKLKIDTVKVLNVQAAYPRIGLTLGNIDPGNVFQVAAAVNTQSLIGSTSRLNIDPIMTEMALAQVRNTMTTDFQWRYDITNQVVYCTHRDPRPATVTITYVPNFKDVSEIQSQTWIDYLVRLSEANMKKSLGRSRSKYTVEGSNVTLDGTILLDEANAELEQIREELEAKKTNLTFVN